MRVAIASPEPVLPARGGAERAWDGLEAAISRLTDHTVEQVKLPVDERTLLGLLDGYRRFAALDLSAYDLVITSKYPAWMLDHLDHRLLLFHPLRGLYDTYHLFGLPETVLDPEYRIWRVLEIVRAAPDRARLGQLFQRIDRLVAALGPDHPDLALPGPLAREVVHWLDRIGMAPGAVRRHQALSRTVALRAGYFPDGVAPQVIHLPSDLPASAAGPDRGPYFFTCSRLDRPKRIDLLIDAVAEARTDIPLLIAGSGPAEAELRERARGVPQVELLGRLSDEDLAAHYAGALATLFVPLDEDLGLITWESHHNATPVVTTLDAGGPTEQLADGVTGLVVQPTPRSLARALDRLACDPAWARRMGEAGRRASEAITWEKAVGQVLAPLSRAPGGHRPAAATSDVHATTVSTYGIYPPRGGGPLRYLHLYGAAARRVGIEIVSMVDPPFSPTTVEIAPGLVETAVAASPEQWAIDQGLSGRLAMPTTDIVYGRDVLHSPEYLAALRRSVEGSDVVLLSHPFLLPAFDAIGSDRPFVFDAHNVETDLKRAILPDNHEGRALIDFVEQVELRATREAQTVVCCSVEDAEILSARSGRSLDGFVVIPNGTDIDAPITPPAARSAASRRWRQHWSSLARPAVEPSAMAIFVASWHQPNLDAAQALIDLAPDLPDVLILLVGSHGRFFQGRRLPPNVVLVGVVSDLAKRTLLACADVALNPMRTGSGTNLKTVEYFAAGIPVVSTPFGVRGLDASDEHLVLTDANGFAAAVRSVLADPDAAHRRALAARRLVEQGFSWTSLGDRLADVLEKSVQSAGSVARNSRR